VKRKINGETEEGREGRRRRKMNRETGKERGRQKEERGG
jgi:hypothetical protein